MPQAYKTCFGQKLHYWLIYICYAAVAVIATLNRTIFIGTSAFDAALLFCITTKNITFIITNNFNFLIFISHFINIGEVVLSGGLALAIFTAALDDQYDARLRYFRSGVGRIMVLQTHAVWMVVKCILTFLPN